MKLIALVLVLTGCVDSEPDPHEVVPCEGQSYNGIPITQCEAACSPYPDMASAIPCDLEDGQRADYTFGWSPARVRGICVVQVPVTRWIQCVD